MPEPKTENLDPADAAQRIATAVKNIDTGIRKIKAAGLTERAIVLMINDLTGGHKHGVSKDTIKRVLEALPKLKQEYLTP